MSRRSRPAADTAEASLAAGGAEAAPQAVARTGAAPPRPAVTVAVLMVVPAVVLLMDGNLSVQSVLWRFVGALALTWLAASLIGSTVRSARRSLAQARAEAAAEEARQKKAARKAAKAKAAEAGAAEAGASAEAGDPLAVGLPGAGGPAAPAGPGGDATDPLTR